MKGSDKESAKAKRKPHPKQQKGRDAKASGGTRKRHIKATAAPRGPLAYRHMGMLLSEEGGRRLVSHVAPEKPC